jgi:hypothetical protein
MITVFAMSILILIADMALLALAVGMLDSITFRN